MYNIGDTFVRKILTLNFHTLRFVPAPWVPTHLVPELLASEINPLSVWEITHHPQYHVPLIPISTCASHSLPFFWLSGSLIPPIRFLFSCLSVIALTLTLFPVNKSRFYFFHLPPVLFLFSRVSVVALFCILSICSALFLSFSLFVCPFTPYLLPSKPTFLRTLTLSIVHRPILGFRWILFRYCIGKFIHILYLLIWIYFSISGSSCSLSLLIQKKIWYYRQSLRYLHIMYLKFNTCSTKWYRSATWGCGGYNYSNPVKVNSSIYLGDTKFAKWRI